MSEERNKETIRRYYEAYNTGDLGAFDALFAPAFVAHVSGQTTRPESGVQFHRRIATWARASFTDLHDEVEDLLADGDEVVDRVSASGTPTGEFRTRFGTFPPTGQRLTWTEITIHRFVGVKIAEQWFEVDWAGLLVQLGVLSTPTAT